MHPHKRLIALSVSALLAGTVAGCGSDGGGGEESGSTGTATGSESVTSAPESGGEESPGTTDASGSAEPSDAPTSASGSESPSPSSSAGDTPSDGKGGSPSSSSDESAAPGTGGGKPAARPDDPDAGPVRLAVVGDLKLAHRAAEDINAGQGQKVFAGVADELAGADLTLGNLETTIGTAADQGDKQPKRYTFMSPPASVELLRRTGFDHVSLANNHTYDFGEPGILSTVEHLQKGSMPFGGAGKDSSAAREPAVLESNGRRIAVLSYVDVPPDDVVPFRNEQWEAQKDRAGVAWGRPQQIADDVSAVRDQVDDVLVILHAGTENETVLNDAQRQMAKAALDAGATAALTHHAHVLQGYRVDEEDGTMVAWGLGNFVFDGYPQGAEQTESAILNLTLDDQGVTDVSFTPVTLQDGYPVALSPDSGQGRAILDRLEKLPNR
ncbi:CapA family protein [Kytococcus sp. Marseille-QA3725]